MLVITEVNIKVTNVLRLRNAELSNGYEFQHQASGHPRQLGGRKRERPTFFTITARKTKKTQNSLKSERDLGENEKAQHKQRWLRRQLRIFRLLTGHFIDH